MRRVCTVPTGGGGSYPLLCGAGVAGALAALWQPAWRQAVLVGDSNTVPRFAAPLQEVLQSCADRVLTLTFAAGEASKTRATKEELEDALADGGIDRSGCIVAVGGGVVLDLAGFVAATYLRGVPHINVATSLLAQVDAAIGGKTGVNTSRGKNLVGAFHAPRAVLLDTEALASLPPAEYLGGVAEVIKHAMIADAELFAALERWADSGAARLPDAVVARAAELKAMVVAADELEQGRRAVLNFGHTAAHGIEAATDHAVAHGPAVAAGMVVEIRLAEALGLLSGEVGDRLEALLAKVGLPTAPQCGFAAALPFLSRDKKNLAGAIHVALPVRLGSCAAEAGRWTRAVDVAAFERAWSRPAD
ncbi:MAG: 3-dehydroquinate synthase [Planctomycetota bacterium]